MAAQSGCWRRDPRAGIIKPAHFYLYLGRQDQIKNSALSAISSPKRGHNIPRALSEKAAAKLIEEARKHSFHAKRAEWIGARDAAILLLLYGAGLRISEALNLNVEDIPTQAGAALRIIGKGSKERLVPLLPIVRDAIKTYLRLCPFAKETKVAKEALFRAQSGRRLGARQVQLLMKNLRQSFALSERATPHALRHSLRLICSDMAAICARSKNCSAMPVYPPRRSILKSTPRRFFQSTKKRIPEINLKAYNLKAYQGLHMYRAAFDSERGLFHGLAQCRMCMTDARDIFARRAELHRDDRLGDHRTGFRADDVNP